MVILSRQDDMLQALDHSVSQITDFLIQVDDNFFDGQQTAREVVSHLVFWHREYVNITEAMVNNLPPTLRQSTFVALNAQSIREFKQMSMIALCQEFLEFQQMLKCNLKMLPDWKMEFPVKKGCRRANAFERVQMIQEHLDSHLIRLQRAHRLGEEWVEAYFPERRHAHH